MKKRIFALLSVLLIALVLVGCKKDTTTAAPTKAPTTAAPTTKAPTTKAPTTVAPTTENLVAKLQADYDALVESLGSSKEVADSITLPATGSNGSTIVWESSDETVITSAGVAKPHETIAYNEAADTYSVPASKTAKLTATLSLTGVAGTAKHIIDVVVPTKNATELAELVKAINIINANYNGIEFAASNTTLLAKYGTNVKVAYSTESALITIPAEAGEEGFVVELAHESEVKRENVKVEVSIGEVKYSFTIVMVITADNYVVYDSIAALYEGAKLDDEIKVDGVVTSFFVGGLFVFDGTNSLGLYGSFPEETKIGDKITIKGAYAVYNSLYQIVPAEVIILSSDNEFTLPEITVSSMEDKTKIDTTNKGFHGTLVNLENVLIKAEGSYNNLYFYYGTEKLGGLYYNSLAASIDAAELFIGKVVNMQVVFYSSHSDDILRFTFNGTAEDITEVTLSPQEALDNMVSTTELVGESFGGSIIDLPTFEAGYVPTWTVTEGADVATISEGKLTFATSTEAKTVKVKVSVAKEGLTAAEKEFTINVLVPLPVSVTEALAAEVNELLFVKGQVISTNYSGFFLTDGEEVIYVYLKNTGVEVGQTVTVYGKRAAYTNNGNNLQQISDAKMVKISGYAGTVAAIATTGEDVTANHFALAGTPLYLENVEIASYDNTYCFIKVGTVGEKDLFIKFRVADEAEGFKDSNPVGSKFEYLGFTIYNINYDNIVVFDMVFEKPANPTPNPNEEGVVSIEQALIDCAALENKSYSEADYILKGVVTNVQSSKYQNFDLAAIYDFDVKILVYGTKDAEGKTNNYSLNSLGISEGDIVIIKGKLQNYNGTLEIPNVEVIEIIHPTFEVEVTNDDEKGTIAGLPETYENGDEVSFTVTPADGYAVSKVSVNGTVLVATEGTYSIKLVGLENAKVVVEYKESGDDNDDEPAETKIVFATANSDGSTRLTTENFVSSIVTSGAANISEISAIDNIFAGVKGVKFGTSSKAGSITIVFAEAVTKVVLTTTPWVSTSDVADGAVITINGETSTNGEWSFAEAVNIITITTTVAAKARFYMVSIEIE